MFILYSQLLLFLLCLVFVFWEFFFVRMILFASVFIHIYNIPTSTISRLERKKVVFFNYFRKFIRRHLFLVLLPMEGFYRLSVSPFLSFRLLILPLLFLSPYPLRETFVFLRFYIYITLRVSEF